MSDIVERLRSPEVLICDGSLISPVAYEAADRIEALEAEVARLREALEYALPIVRRYAHTQGDNAEFHNEIARPIVDALARR